MPELPEVQTVVNTLSPRVSGSLIVSGTVMRSDILTPEGFDFIAGIVGRRVNRVFRRAKRILFALDDGNHFYIHLGMSGRIRIESSDAPPAKHTHLLIDFRTQTGEELQVRFIDPRRFGGVWWVGQDWEDPNLGPEPLDLSATGLAARLDGTKRFVKCALLDQAVIAGLGNIYVDEALHVAGIHPLTRTHRLTREQIAALSKAIKTVLKRAIKHRGSTLRDYVDADGVTGDFQKIHRVYGREDQACLSCGETIKRIVVGGRSTHFCRVCQPRKPASA